MGEDVKLFLNTTPSNIITPDFKPIYFGILDFNPEKIKTAQRFTEPATLEAMVNLGIVSADLMPNKNNDDTVIDPSMKLEIEIEQKKRLLTTIQRIITEREAILQRMHGTLKTINKEEKNGLVKKNKGKETKKIKEEKINNDNKPKKAAKKTKKRAKSVPKTNSSYIDQKSRIPAPPIVRKKVNKNDDKSEKNSTSRRRKKTDIKDSKLHKLFIINKKNKEGNQRKNVNKENDHNEFSYKKKIGISPNKYQNPVRRKNIPSKEVCMKKEKQSFQSFEAEQRRKQQECIKERAKIRMLRQNAMEAKMREEKERIKKSEYDEMKWREQAYERMIEKKNWKFEQEKKKRMQKIYSTPFLNKDPHPKKNLSELRKKMVSKAERPVPSFGFMLDPNGYNNYRKVKSIVPEKGSKIPYIKYAN